MNFQFIYCLIAQILFFVVNGDGQVEGGKKDPLPYHIPIELGILSEQLNLLLDVNGEESWIFADQNNKLLNSNVMCKNCNFNATYEEEFHGFDASFYGYTFKEYFYIDKNQHSANKKFETQIGFVFSSTLNDVSNFSDGILGLDTLAQNLSAEEKQITVATKSLRDQTHLIVGLSNKEQHCINSTLYEPTIQQTVKLPKWSFLLRNVTFGQNFETHHNHSDTQTAILSSLNPEIVGPKLYVDWLYQKLDVQQTSDSKWPQVNCSLIEKASNLEFYSERSVHRVLPESYIKQMDQTCYLLVLPSAQHNHWILGQPFFAGRCLTFDYNQNKIGFTNSL